MRQSPQHPRLIRHPRMPDPKPESRLCSNVINAGDGFRRARPGGAPHVSAYASRPCTADPFNDRPRDACTPVLVAPMAHQVAAHPDGEAATGRAVAASGSLLGVSTNTAVPFAAIAHTHARWWFQVYEITPRAEFDLGACCRGTSGGSWSCLCRSSGPLGPRRCGTRRRAAGNQSPER